jgi:hypothetical protein
LAVLLLLSGCLKEEPSRLREAEVRDAKPSQGLSQVSSPTVKAPDETTSQMVPCSVDIQADYRMGFMATIFSKVNISAKNTLPTEVEGVTWVMRSKSGRTLKSKTSIGGKERAILEARSKQVVPIQPGDVSMLATEPEIEFAIHAKPSDDDGSKMQAEFEKRLNELKEKYGDVTCEILGFMKKVNSQPVGQ